jgi:hypothetical protein
MPDSILDYADTAETNAVRDDMRRVDASLERASITFVDDGVEPVDVHDRTLRRLFVIRMATPWGNASISAGVSSVAFGSHLVSLFALGSFTPRELLERGLVRRGQFQLHVYERMMRGCGWSVDETTRGCGCGWEAEAMTHPPRPCAGLGESPIESLGSLER